jgi:error-prone DNA polymerase
MGFYAAAQIISDARSHVVHIRPIDVTRSDWDCTLSDGALQLGLRLIEGFRDGWAAQIMQARRLYDLASLAACEVPRSALELLAEADALRGIGLDRRRALWQIGQLDRAPTLPLLVPLTPPDGNAALSVMQTGEDVVTDYQTTTFSLRAHPLALLRRHSALAGTKPCACLATARDGSLISLAGLITVRQRPGSAKGTMFITIEDETGIANLILWLAIVASFSAVIIAATLLRAAGQVQRSAEGVVHVIIENMQDCSALIGTLDAPLARADEDPSRPASPRRPSPR